MLPAQKQVREKKKMGERFFLTLLNRSFSCNGAGGYVSYLKAFGFNNAHMALFLKAKMRGWEHRPDECSAGI